MIIGFASKEKGQHSIRIDDQWRICFVWTDSGPGAVEIALGKRGITADTALRLAKVRHFGAILDGVAGRT